MCKLIHELIKCVHIRSHVPHANVFLSTWQVTWTIFSCYLLCLFFLVKISKHLCKKGSTFYSWAVKHGTTKNGLTMHGISIYSIGDE